MNLYRSFGNLMEVWVAEEFQCSDSEIPGSNEDSPTASSDTGTNCESLDSGVETGSSDTSCAATFCSTEMDAFTPERDSGELTPTSTLQSPFLSSAAASSSSSPRLCPSRAQEGSAALNHKVEQALKRINSKSLKTKPEPFTADELPWRRTCPSLLPKRHSSEVVRGQRSQKFYPGRTADPSVSSRQMSEKCRRELSVSQDQLGSEDLYEERREQLSPGLIYLEQVCQMLEGIARQQMRNRALQTESVVLQQRHDTDEMELQTGSDSEDAEEKPSSCQRLENTGNEEHISTVPPLIKNPYTHFRARSASDTTIATLHRRKLSADCRGQHLSTYDLNLETAEGDQKKLESILEETDKPKKSWKFRIGSLRREMSTKSQQTQPPEKNSTRRRLSQLFRRRRTILPE